MQSAVLEQPKIRHPQNLSPRFIHEEIKFISLSGPSGVGKNYLMNRLVSWAESSNLALGILQTNATRLLRANQDHEYRHMSKEEFIAREKNGEFAWTALYKDNLYGTLTADIEHAKTTPYPWLIHVTVDTVHHIRGAAPGRVLSIFCHASIETLRYNLMNRPDNPEISPEELNELIRKRLASAHEEEAQAAKSKHFNLILNTDHRQRNNEEIFEEVLRCLQKKPGR